MLSDNAEKGRPFIQFPDDLVIIAMEHIRAEKMQHTVGRHSGEFPQFFIQSRARTSSTLQFREQRRPHDEQF